MKRNKPSFSIQSKKKITPQIKQPTQTTTVFDEYKLFINQQVEESIQRRQQASLLLHPEKKK